MKYSINLASRSYINKRALYVGYAICGVILIGALLFNGGYFLSLTRQIETTTFRLNELEGKLIASQGGDVASYSAQRYEKVLEEIALANDILRRDAFRWTALLDQLEEVVPGDVSIRKIEPDHMKRSVKIDGLARGLKGMNRFLDNLIKSGNYKEVLLLSQASVEVAGSASQLGFSIELLGAF